MWSWEKNGDIAEKNQRIDSLENELTRKCNEVVHLKDKIKDLTDVSRSSTFFFDFTAVKAFSVERNIGVDGMPNTIIGYLLPVVSDGNVHHDVKEWYLKCDDKQHESIVKSFKESRK
jgi:predicted RNase H-like nuclease (RuvC/YqgF family)